MPEFAPVPDMSTAAGSSGGGFWVGNQYVNVPPGYEFSSPDLSNLGDRFRYGGGGESLGEQAARMQAGGQAPDLSNLNRLSRSAPAESLAERAARVGAVTDDLSNSVRSLESGGAVRDTLTAPRPANAPAPVRIPTAETTIAAPTGIGGAVSRGVGILSIPGELNDLRIGLGNVVTGTQNLGRILTGEAPEPLQDYPQARAMQERSESQGRAFADRLRRVMATEDTGEAYRNSPVIRPVQDFLAPITCSLFGVGCDSSTPEGVPYSGDRVAAPPFYGGQSDGVQYRVYFNLTRTRWYDGYPETSVQTGTIAGRITGVGVEFNDPNWASYIYNDKGQKAGTAGGYAFTYYNYQWQRDSFTAAITSISRVDGLPDTGGNVAPAPGTPPGAANAPVVNNPLDRRPRNYQQNQPVATPTIIPSNPPEPTTQPPEREATPRSGQSGSPGGILPTLPGTGTPAGTPANPPATPAPESRSPQSPAQSPFVLPYIPMIPGRVGTPQTPTVTASQFPAGRSTSTTTGGSEQLTCQYDNKNISGKVDQTNTTLGVIQTVLQDQILGKVNTIDTKLGDQLDGGIGGYFQKFWKWAQIDRILGILTFITALHNAQMLSTSIAQSLFSAFDSLLETFGVHLKDDKGENIDTSGWVSDKIEDYFKSIFGDQTVETVQKNWKKWNKIYQATANIINSFQSIAYSILGALEQVGQYVAWIGNALRRFGTVTEDAYRIMNPNPNFRQNRFFKVLDGLQEGADAIDNVASEVLNVAQMRQEIAQQTTELRTNIAEGVTTEGGKDGTAKEVSTYPEAPLVRNADLNKPEV